MCSRTPDAGRQHGVPGLSRTPVVARFGAPLRDALGVERPERNVDALHRFESRDALEVVGAKPQRAQPAAKARRRVVARDRERHDAGGSHQVRIGGSLEDRGGAAEGAGAGVRVPVRGSRPRRTCRSGRSCARRPIPRAAAATSPCSSGTSSDRLRSGVRRSPPHARSRNIRSAGAPDRGARRRRHRTAGRGTWLSRRRRVAATLARRRDGLSFHAVRGGGGGTGRRRRRLPAASEPARRRSKRAPSPPSPAARPARPRRPGPRPPSMRIASSVYGP